VLNGLGVNKCFKRLVDLNIFRHELQVQISLPTEAVPAKLVGFDEFPLILDSYPTDVPAIEAPQRFGLAEAFVGRHRAAALGEVARTVLKQLDDICEERKFKQITTTWAALPFILGLDTLIWLCCVALRHLGRTGGLQAMADEFRFAADAAWFYRRLISKRFTNCARVEVPTRAILREVCRQPLGPNVLNTPFPSCRKLIGSMIYANTSSEVRAKRRRELMLHTAVDTGRLELLELALRVKPNLTSVDEKARTVIHKAILGRQCDMVKRLSAYGFTHDIRDGNNRTPLELAFYLEDTELIQQLSYSLGSLQL
jgi:hypothetical protein